MASTSTVENTVPVSLDLKLDPLTKKRLEEVSFRRKKSGEKSGERRSALQDSLGKWTDPDPMMESSSSHARPSVRKKKSRKDGLSQSDHGMSSRVRRKKDEDRVVRPGENNGKLGSMLNQMSNGKPAKKHGARSVVSEVPRNKVRDTEKPFIHPNKHRPGELQKKRPVKHYPGELRSPDSPKARRRSQSPHSLRKRTQSPGRLRERRSERGERTTRAEPVSRPGDNSGKLGSMLDKMGGSSKTKRGGSKSVASAPAMSRQESRRERRSNSQGPIDARARRSRRTKSMDLDNSLVMEEPPPSRRKGKKDGTKKSSKKLSRNSTKSFRKKQRPEDDETSETHQGDSSSIEDRTERPDRRSMMTSQKRSKSTGPRLACPKKAPKQDRRADMQRARSMAPSTQAQDDDESSPHHVRHAQSMMLHRDKQRRGGKSSSLMDLVHYKDEEIHSTSYFASNHVLVNRERMKRGLRPLTRNIAMDEMARQSAQSMADNAGVAPLQTTYIGNVLRGESIRAIHKAVMQNKEGRERHNCLNPYFQDFGVGTAKGEDGMLYVCQLFSERLELTCTSTND